MAPPHPARMAPSTAEGKSRRVRGPVLPRQQEEALAGNNAVRGGLGLGASATASTRLPSASHDIVSNSR